MSEEDVEIVRRAHAEFLTGLSHGDPAAAFGSGIVAPEFEWVLPAEAPGLQQVYRGREGWVECAPGPRISTGRSSSRKRSMRETGAWS
jgi:hypothetical protein